MEGIGASRLCHIILRQKTEFCRDGTKTPVSVTDNRTFMNCWDTFRTKPTQYTNLSTCRDTFLEIMHYALILVLRAALNIRLTVWFIRFDKCNSQLAPLHDIRCKFILR